MGRYPIKSTGATTSRVIRHGGKPQDGKYASWGMARSPPATTTVTSSGAFTTGKIRPTDQPPSGKVSQAPAEEAPLRAELVQVPEHYEAVGTVRPMSEAT